VVDALWRSAYRIAFRLRKLYWRVHRSRLTGAYVAVWQDERLLVIQNSYRRLFSLPAGGLARGERPIDAALRELQEEVSIAARPEELHYVGEIVSFAGATEDHAHFFELRPEGEIRFAVDRREVVWADFLSPEDALERGVVDLVRQYLERTRGGPRDTMPGT
jgi:ADP-ribose pyrophosphatase YjhB (NUDIX family)